ncbi:uncharacterized protein PFL1_06633 [Pseudozyma flocculosa PF-1]|uniref:DUF654-domain-containing protein n=1 Tax=Pseudozyma flocculosa PF-1 TaxID=1277687 RepID=A0A061H555_9BASI|nr:uncharacterized protein PFL1_06633 [Pseudozyma flocculosa PF-1]EPQ25766.1 hypothetical protein PFL1_06633 [Pseudozyma flocculosa PF-1]
MSGKRLNKRQLREQQELQELAQAQAAAPAPGTAPDQPNDADHGHHSPQQQPDDDDDDDINAAPAAKQKKSKKANKQQPPPASIFAALGDQQDNDDDEADPDAAPADDDNDDEPETSPANPATTAKKKNKKKKKPKKAPADGDDDAHSSPAPPPSKKASKKASGTASAAPAKDVDDMTMDELNALLESQAKLADQQRRADQGKPGSSATLRPVSFGSAAIKAFESESAAAGASAGARARAQATNSNLKLRSHLSQPKDYWPPIGRTFTGINMDVRDTRSGRLCSWQHGKAYKQVQLQFLQAVRSHDPNALMALLRVYPWHIDTLLQLSDYSRHQGDLGQAADFNSRALFAFERTASPYFTSCLSSTTSGPPMVDFLKIENRAFYLAVHRNLGFLGRRGTWRTALEWAKILLGLGRDGDDHHAALLWIDFLAIKAKQARWLVELCDKLDLQRGRQRGGGVKRVEEISVRAETCIDDEKADAGEGDGYEGTLDWCVGLQYARALAFKAIEREEKDKSGRRSRAALRLAMARYPMAVPLLANKVGIDLPGSLVTHPLFELRTRYGEAGDDSLPHLLSQIYALRSESLWKEPGYPEWLRDTAVELFPVLKADYEATGAAKRAKAAVADLKTRQGIYRHVLVSDLPDSVRQQLVGHLPTEVTRNGEMMDAFDPIPPVSTELYGTVEGEGEGEGDEDRATRYDDEYFAPIMGSGGGSRGGSGGGSRAQGQQDEAGLIQAFMRAMQGVGGLRGWDAAMEGMDDETREDVMAQILEMTAQARRERGAGEDEPPGGFGFDRDGQDDDEEGGGGDEARGGGGAFAALRNALNAVWGMGGTAHQPAAAEDEDDGFETEDDDEQ